MTFYTLGDEKKSSLVRYGRWILGVVSVSIVEGAKNDRPGHKAVRKAFQRAAERSTASLLHRFPLLAHHAALVQSQAGSLSANDACVRDIDSRALERAESCF